MKNYDLINAQKKMEYSVLKDVLINEKLKKSSTLEFSNRQPSQC